MGGQGQVVLRHGFAWAANAMRCSFRLFRLAVTAESAIGALACLRKPGCVSIAARIAGTGTKVRKHAKIIATVKRNNGVSGRKRASDQSSDFARFPAIIRMWEGRSNRNRSSILDPLPRCSASGRETVRRNGCTAGSVVEPGVRSPLSTFPNQMNSLMIIPSPRRNDDHSADRGFRSLNRADSVVQLDSRCPHHLYRFRSSTTRAGDPCPGNGSWTATRTAPSRNIKFLRHPNREDSTSHLRPR